MDPCLETRGSNDLGGAMFKGEHVRVHLQATLKSRLFDSTKGGERKQEREDQFKLKTMASPNYKEKVKTQVTSKARFVFAKLCNFICFRNLFVIIKKGEIVEATLSRSPCVLMITNKPSKHIK